MKKLDETLLESIKHILANHPDLRTPIFDYITNTLKIKAYDLIFIYSMNHDLIKKSRSQLRQDLFVLYKTNFKKNGYFVEFGATDGVELSNTYLLEKEYGWTGILAEPAKKWHQNLINNRQVNIETNCVWSSSGNILDFNEVEAGELSTIDQFSGLDSHKDARKSGKKYEVKTISLNDLLDKYDAPKNIDYLSIDTEGSEYEILSSFDFTKRSIQLITCEHNYTPARDLIHKLLTSKGYKRIYETLSRFDDWYEKI